MTHLEPGIRRHRPAPANTLIIVLGTVVAVLAVGAVIIAVLALGRLGDQARELRASNDRLAQQATALRAVVGRIQDERRENVLRACLETNARHDAVIARLDAIIRAMPAGARRRRAEANRASTVALLEALAPRRDCEALAERSVKAEQP